MKKRILIPILVCVFVASLLCACSKDINFTFPKYNVNKTPTKEDPLVKDEGACGLTVNCVLTIGRVMGQ